MTTPNTGIGAITKTTLRTMRAKLEEATAIARAAEGCAANGQPRRAPMIALDAEPLASRIAPIASRCRLTYSCE